jgi:hypothetical protein
MLHICLYSVILLLYELNEDVGHVECIGLYLNE